MKTIFTYLLTAFAAWAILWCLDILDSASTFKQNIGASILALFLWIASYTIVSRIYKLLKIKEDEPI